MNILVKLKNKLKNKIYDDNYRQKAQFIAVYIILFFVSIFMTVINVITGFKLLTISTAIFSLCCLVDIIFCAFKGVFEKIARVLFFIQTTTLFTSFIIIGEPEGFSSIWAALMPACGLLLYRKKNGTYISALMLLILIILLWTPQGYSLLQYNYTRSFRLRFPILYTAFYFVGLMFELIREYTQNALTKSNKRYRYLSYYDQLTGLRNERSYFEEIEKLDKLTKEKNDDYIIMLMDLNGLKVINDKFGHTYGCHLIIETANILKEIFTNSLLFHVGGDEFEAIILGDDLKNFDKLMDIYNQKLVYNKIIFDEKELILSVACGYARSNHQSLYRELFKEADKKMYENKEFIKEKYKVVSR